MAVSMKDVRRILDPEEPNYRLRRNSVRTPCRTWGPGHGDDPMLARKAVYAAGLLEGPPGRAVRAASHSTDPVVRVAAAATARNLPAARGPRFSGISSPTTTPASGRWLGIPCPTTLPSDQCA